MINLAKIKRYIYGSQAFAKLFEQPSYDVARCYSHKAGRNSVWFRLSVVNTSSSLNQDINAVEALVLHVRKQHIQCVR